MIISNSSLKTGRLKKVGVAGNFLKKVGVGVTNNGEIYESHSLLNS